MLYQDALAYFKNKGDELAAGVVELQGCSVLSPCPQYTKKQVSYWTQMSVKWRGKSTPVLN